MKNINKTKLIIIEGLPSSGKSYTSKRLSDILNIPYYDENDTNHPIDYVFEAFINDKTLLKFMDNKNEIIDNSSKCLNGYVVKLNNISNELKNKLMKYKIYDSLPWSTEKKLFLDKWKRYTGNNLNKCIIVNSVLLQNPMCEMMMRFNFNEDTNLNYIKRIINIIEPLNPIVIYLKSSNIRSSINRIINERGSEWLNSVINYHCHGLYGKANNLNGFDGYISALEERQKRELNILNKLGIRTIIIEDIQKDSTNKYKMLINEIVK